ncbi:helix-turn-helix transcriptional regulator [Streptomyces coeruleorubidus]|uniref:helix-turn-helix domain-containing protein n=1 Tax=Streptomyces coeruleorubidus TaxID=116188 RepID=UPI00237F7741|nr:helix-turn-helix transcriptional regulator [Streptomyces coeruleorubidus]WDV56653.1 helix-turn-helix transcriptional regulator [Streptomyces coeruleorubidus]
MKPAGAMPPGERVRRTRLAQGMTLAQLGARTGYSAAQVSRLERGESPMTHIDVLLRFARALDIPPQDLGLAPAQATPSSRHSVSTGPYPRLPAPSLGSSGRENGEDAVNRRKLLANLAVTAAAAVGAPITGTAKADEARLGDILVAGLRDAMLGLGASPCDPNPDELPTELARAAAHFNAANYASLATRLPRLLRAGHQAAGTEHYPVLAHSYLLATRVLIKLNASDLGWMAADRARQLAHAAGAPLAVAEAARQQAVLARQAGWRDQALTLALNAAEDPALGEAGKAGAAQRGLLIQCAAYTVAHQGDQEGMRELTAEAAAIAKSLGHTTHLRDTAGGFSTATVQLHLISAEYKAGDPSAAIAAADALDPKLLPTVERQALYYMDRATAYARWERREECISALLEAERLAPEETHARPAVKAMLSGLLVSGRTTPELRGLAARSGVLT